MPSKGYNHPYTIEMKQQLEEDIKGTRIIVDNEGKLAQLHACTLFTVL